MRRQLITDEELCWILNLIAPAKTTDIVQRTPLQSQGVYQRLRRLNRGGYVVRGGTTHTVRWSLSDTGQELAAEADLPSAADTDFEAYFADRQRKATSRETILTALAGHGWERTADVADRLSIGIAATRKRLYKLVEDGLVELDDSGNVYQWRITAPGRDKLDSHASDG